MHPLHTPIDSLKNLSNLPAGPTSSQPVVGQQAPLYSSAAFYACIKLLYTNPSCQHGPSPQVVLSTIAPLELLT